ncbi:hypothetical protein LZL12_15640 [Pseudomonas aeruginosa]|uniref:hypothetical protein n=1 Tax=Pseudomonas aeruginosa TaxID=287 RepID=UPI000F816F84|nr:hypothetical protein [Pseudomonas aeruginosa]MCT5138842.1 hypothetical protein [Pseudomonas aeruginosa]MDP5671817.1 hypothetical protein [Pseudomonas aeruginosa]RTW26525.1 hypothetical protein DZA01_01905 [Pseudomonas aeruginosa]HEJ2268441.1 hypothetical protein [Pseudomonas aeruginosa]
MAWYSTGTVAVTANSPTVTGTGTQFSSNARVGDAFRGPDGRWYEVTNVASSTVISIKPNYQGSTASGQAYAVAPILGYDKDLSDRFNLIANQWGATLAGIKPWALSANAAAARGDLGLGSAAVREALGSSGALYSRDSILGAVSQSSGVPTGAVIDRGSNANGEYVRFADGTQICWTNTLTFTAGVSSVGANWSYPASFSSSSPIAGAVSASGAGGDYDSGVSARNQGATYFNPSAGTAGVGFFCISSASFTSGAQTRNNRVVAIGRWF